ncbi:unnamed protein product (mitochondrion) [Plasmodiophora brassicae]|uniref:Uncharacterized protein n=1 Tax=Plasmodiophora brassicae TaxID=37360 RepID=A0A3P3Y1P3_PLABS|nr:unnamed protein product [Plasmodiophora brassicae]
MASSSLSPDIDTTVRFGRIPTCDLSAVVCGGVADRQKVVILATATAQVHVLSLRDDAAPHRTFALIVSATGAHRRAPIISLRADEDYMYMLQSPSNRVLYTSMTMDGVVLQIQAGQAAITAIDVVGNSQIMIGDADGRTTLWSLAAHGPIWSYSALTLNDAITAIAACDDVVFAAAKSAPNSTLWLQHHRNELMSSAMTEAPFVDESTVRERAATKAVHVDIRNTTVFGELPPVDVEAPPPPKKEIPKQVDPKWVQSLERRPDIRTALRSDYLEPQHLDLQNDWPFDPAKATAQRNLPPPGNDIDFNMLLRKKLHYWRTGILR